MNLKKLFTMMVALCLLVSAMPIFAANATQIIEVKVNPYGIRVNGKVARADNISYIDKIYIQPQDLCSFLGIEYSIDTKKMILNITDKKSTKYIAPAKQNFANVKAQTVKKINVGYTKLSININGNKVNLYTLQYNSSYYVSVRDACKYLGKDCTVDSQKSIIFINEKKPAMPFIKSNNTKPTKEKISITIDKWGSAVRKEYKINNGKWTSYSKPITMSVCATVYAKGTNVYGVSSDISKYIVKNIDKSAPKLSIKADSPTATNKNVKVSVDWDDAVTKKYKVDKGGWQKYSKPLVFSKNSVFYAQGTDAAGNISVVSKFNINYIDKIPPLAPTFKVSNTFPTKEDVIISIKNPGDGQLEYRIDNGEWASCNANFQMKESGVFQCRTKDLAGNVSQTVSQTINNIDKQGPSMPVITLSNSSKTKDPIKATIDNWGDSQTKEYRIGDGAWQTYAVPIDISTNCTVFARGTDLLGNISEIANVSITNILTKQSVQDIAKKNTSLVLVKVFNATNKPLGTGSGFIISEDGKVVTNYHVVDKATYAEVVTSDNKTFKVSGSISYSVEKDLAVLQLENASGLTPVDIGNSDGLVLGEEIVAIGSPLGLQNTVSTGIVSSIRADINRKGYTDIQISAPVSSGSSGGALFNLYSEVVGVTYAGTDSGQNLNFAVPINDLKPMLATAQLKSLASIKSEVYPNMGLKEFSEYIFDGYATYKIGESTYKMGSMFVDDETLPGELHTIIAVGGADYEYLNQAINNGKKTEIESWINDIISEYKIQYPNKVIPKNKLVKSLFK